MDSTNKVSDSGVSRLFRYEVLLQIEVIVGLAVALGLCFNASNPVGVRFSAEPQAPAAAPTPAVTQTAPVHTTLPPEPVSGISAPVAGIQHILWRQVKPLALSGQVLLVDARPKVNYDHGHIPGAVNLPYSANPVASSKPEDFDAFQAQHPKDTPIVVYCTSKTCQLSQIIAEKLKDLGYTNVRKMEEGWLEYTEEEPSATNAAPAHPISGSSPAPSPVQSPVQPTAAHPASTNPSRTDWAQVKPLLESHKIVLVDVRQAPTYELGHIPGAVNLSYTSGPEAYAEFQKNYPDKDTHLVLYCTDVGCPLSTRMAQILVSNFGYRFVQHMTEGYAEWERAELLAKKGSPQ